MLRLISLVLGIIGVFAGRAIPSTPVLIIGIILAAIGGLWIIIVDGFDFDW